MEGGLITRNLFNYGRKSWKYENYFIKQFYNAKNHF